jgi:hypothetical protein
MLGVRFIIGQILGISTLLEIKVHKYIYMRINKFFFEEKCYVQNLETSLD